MRKFLQNKRNGIDNFSYIIFNRFLCRWKNKMYENLDFETIEKMQKSIEIIDNTFGGNVDMKRAILDK